MNEFIKNCRAFEREGVEPLRHDPRGDILQAIRNGDLAHCLIKTAEIHGHFCPGSALGVMASVYGLNQLGWEAISSDGMEDIMAVVEINACFADGIQAVSGCTLGNNALVYRDLGRMAVTFAKRGSQSGIRIRVKPDFRTHVSQVAPDFFPLMEKVIKNRNGSAKEMATFKEEGREAAFGLIRLPFKDLLIAQKVRPHLPDYAPITESVLCPSCGEMIMATKVVSEGNNRGLCFMCASKECSQVEGQGIIVWKH